MFSLPDILGGGTGDNDPAKTPGTYQGVPVDFIIEIPTKEALKFAGAFVVAAIAVWVSLHLISKFVKS